MNLETPKIQKGYQHSPSAAASIASEVGDRGREPLGFEKPPSAPYSQTIIYHFEFDTWCEPAGSRSKMLGRCYRTSISKVTFDLPDRVTILPEPGRPATQTASTRH